MESLLSETNTNACKHLQFGIRPHSLPIHAGVCVTLTAAAAAAAAAATASAGTAVMLLRCSKNVYHKSKLVISRSRIGLVFNIPTTTTRAEELERTKDVRGKYISDSSSSGGSSKIFNSPNSLECNSNCDLFYALKYNCRSKTFVLKLFFQFQLFVVSIIMMMITMSIFMYFYICVHVNMFTLTLDLISHGKLVPIGGSGSGSGSGSGNGDGSSIHTLEVSSTFGARLHRTSV
uniref:Uncharacterized protein n=1 Tax=Glossina pallidipes TaxID=7398 RepID=A0A1A9ZIS6_GLOPL